MNAYGPLDSPVALSVLGLTLVLPIAIGVLALRRTANQSDFFVGGRSMGRWVVALSAVSSGRSSWLVLGVSGLAFSTGLSAIWAVVGYTFVEWLQCLVLGPRLRRDSESLGAITVPDVLALRFGEAGRTVRATAALLLVGFVTAYVAAQLHAGAKTLNSALGWPLAGGLAAAAAIILVYMVLGGFVAVAYNDVVRAVVMLIGLVVLPLVALSRIEEGGLALALEAHPAHLDPFALSAGAFLGLVGIGLGSPGQPHLLVRYMSIDDAGKLPAVAWIGLAWNLVLGSGAVAIGVLGAAFWNEAAQLPNGDPEMVYLALAGDNFGPLLFGLVVGGVFAAILSTADSQLLVVASTFIRDLWEGTFGRTFEKERDRLRLSRWIVLLSGVLAVALAWFAEDLVFWLVLFAWSGLGAAFGPAVIFALLWRGTTRQGVLGGMLVGATTTVLWRLWWKESTGIYELVPAFLASGAAVLLLSLATGRSPAARARDRSSS